MLSPLETHKQVYFNDNSLSSQQFPVDLVEKWKKDPISNYLLNYMASTVFEVLDKISTSKGDCEFYKGVCYACNETLRLIEEKLQQEEKK